MADQGSSDSSAESRPARGPPIVSNKALTIFGCVGAGISIVTFLLGQTGVLPRFFLTMGIVFLFVVIIVVFFLFLVKNLPAANRASVPSSPESENSTDVHPVIYTPPDVPKSPSSEEDSSISLPLHEKDKTEPPSSPDSGPVAIAVAAQISESDSGIGKTCLSTDCSTIQEITSLTSEKGKDSDDDIKDPLKPIKVETGSEKFNEDPDNEKSAKSLKVLYTPHSQETVTTIVDQSTSSSVTEGTAV